MPMRSMQWPISLHRDYAIRDNEVGRRRGADIQNAPMDAFPMENVLGPAVLGPRNDAEHVLHTERDACPMVRLDLGHRNNEVRRTWKCLRDGLGPDLDFAVDFHARPSPTVATIILREIEPLHLLFAE